MFRICVTRYIISLFCFNLCFFFALPSFKSTLLQQHCRRFVFELEAVLEWTSLQASLQHKPLSIELDRLLQVKTANALVLRDLSIKPFQLQWNSRHALLFHVNPLHNHLNGLFSLDCGSGIKYHVWLNRIGHVRVEAL